MNVSQLKVDIRDKLSAGGGENTALSVDTFWGDAEIINYINQGYRKVTNAIRRARAEYFTRIIKSSDSALAILGKSYDPAILKMTTGVGTYQLPFDFVRIIGIYDAREEDKIVFRGSSVVNQEMKSLYSLSNDNNISSGTVIYDIIGKRTLLVRPKPSEDFDIEIIYERLLDPLDEYTVGTIDVTKGSDTATFTDADLANRFVVGDEIIVGSVTDAPIPSSSEIYVSIKSIDVGSNMVTFDSIYPFASATGAKYIRARVPEMPMQHIDALSHYGVYRGFSKGTNPNIESAHLAFNDFNSTLADITSDVEVRQYQDMQFGQAYLEDLYDAE